MSVTKFDKILRERFGDPIGSYAGDAPVGVRDLDDVEVCEDCGMMPVEGVCGCGGDVSPCDKCNMLEVAGSCGCTLLDESDDALDEVAPPGYEKTVKALKKEPSIDNPWALAWSMKKKGVKPKK